MQVSETDLEVEENQVAKFAIVDPCELCGDRSTYTYNKDDNQITVTAVDSDGNPITNLSTNNNDWTITGLTSTPSDGTVLSITRDNNIFTITVENLSQPSDGSETVTYVPCNVMITRTDTTTQ